MYGRWRTVSSGDFGLVIFLLCFFTTSRTILYILSGTEERKWETLRLAYEYSNVQ